MCPIIVIRISFWFQPLDHMIRTLEHWFQMVVAPPGLADAINGMMRLRGYYTPRQDELGQILVSSMFVMHSKAAQVKCG